MEVKLNCVIALINRSGLPKSSNKTASPPINKEIAVIPDNPLLDLMWEK